MNATIQAILIRSKADFCAIAIACLLLSPAVTSAATFSIVDGEGFESPDYSTTAGGTGRLEGQVASTEGGFLSAQWKQSPAGGTGTAVVQNTVVASGSQAVRVDKAANSDDRWAVPVVGFPDANMPIICIDWDMRVEQTISASFGPFFGIEAYDDNGVDVTRLGMLGVDASTGEVLYGDRNLGLWPVPGGQTVNFGEWNSFRLVLDYTTDLYYGFVNGALVLNAQIFEFPGNPGSNGFTDADISALAAAGGPVAAALTGTAYFDNYSVVQTDDLSKLVPEPSSLVILVAGFALAAARSRS